MSIPGQIAPWAYLRFTPAISRERLNHIRAVNAGLISMFEKYDEPPTIERFTKRDYIGGYWVVRHARGGF